jgi:hypothetical protein
MPTVDFLQSKADEWTDINDNLVACLGIFMQAPPVPWVYTLKFASPQK